MDLARALGLKLNQIEDRGVVGSLKTGDRVPKIVHQTYPTKALPAAIAQNVESLRAANPGWTFKLYDDADIDDFIGTHFPALMPIYRRIDTRYGAARADFFRYLLLYQAGGVYLDIKSSVRRPLDELVTPATRFVLGHWSNGYGRHSDIADPRGEFQQWHIVCVSGHPFLKAVIENVCRNIGVYNPIFHDTGYYGVLKLTGPIAYTLAITPLLPLHAHTTGSDQELGLVYSIFEGQQPQQGVHAQLFKHHYSRLKAPIVRQPWFVRPLAPLLGGLRVRVKRRLYGAS